MQVDVDKMLRRAADCEQLASPGDRLSELVNLTHSKSELSEGALDQVAAAVKQVGENPPDPKK